MLMSAWGKAVLFVVLCAAIILAVQPAAGNRTSNGIADPNPMRFDPVQKERMEKALAAPVSGFAYEK